MQDSRGTILIGLPILLSLFLILTPGEADAGPQFLVRDFQTENEIIRLPIEYGQTITLGYIHSVDRSPVYEVFRIDKEKGLVLEETYFRVFGAGMGHWSGHGALEQDGEWTRIRKINRPIGAFFLRIGPIEVAHTIIYADHALNLSEIAPGKRVEVLVTDE